MQTAGPPAQIGLPSTWGWSSASSVQVSGEPQAQTGRGRRGTPGWGILGGTQSTLTHSFPILSGQHRALGSGISKVQSLKLDTSVWSNEIVQVRGLREAVGNREGASRSRLGVQLGGEAVRRLLSSGHSSWPLVILQLFIVLGNDRANSFWAGALPPGEGLHPDSAPGPRGEFISRKYKLGLFRKPHPQHPDHSQLLQVKGTGRCSWGMGCSLYWNA